MGKKYLKLFLTFPYWIPIFLATIISSFAADFFDHAYGSFYDWIYKEELEMNDARDIFMD